MTFHSMHAFLFACLLTAGASAHASAPSQSIDDLKDRFTAALPADAREVAAAMTTVKVGETITLRGNVALSKDAFVENRAMFTLADESTRKGCCPPSSQLPETACDIPPEGRATIQITGAGGRPLRFSLDGRYGLKAGAEVFVTGRVVTANGKDALVIEALSMHVPRAPLPTDFFTDTSAPDARDVSEARRAGSLAVGDKVVLRGRVGGSAEPFVSGRALFTLMGRGLKACNEIPGDACTKPWDYCCETREAILANSVTVQVVDAGGQVLRTDMKGRRGLKELSELVVVGTVASAEGGAVVINATNISVPR